jgi:polyphosphate kinase
MSRVEDHVPKSRPKLSKSTYQEELKRWQFELVRWQYWVKERGQRIVVVFEGRDAAVRAAPSSASPSRSIRRGVWLVALQKPSVLPAVRATLARRR